jgi:hypothetical protein
MKLYKIRKNVLGPMLAEGDSYLRTLGGWRNLEEIRENKYGDLTLSSVDEVGLHVAVLPRQSFRLDYTSRIRA